MTSLRPVVSIALPVRNGGKDLRLAVQSIIEQSFQDWELLLIDDGSSDAAIGELPRSDTRIRIFTDGATRGLTARLNQAIDLARGSFIARMDHDDVSHPERLARQVAFLENHPAIDLVGTGCATMSEAERVTGVMPLRTTHAEICAQPWRGFYLPHPTWMGKTSWFRTHRYRDPGPYRCEDQELLLRTYATSRFAALPEVLLAYRVRQHPRMSTLLRTRAAMLGIALSHFRREGDVTSMARSSAAFVVRIGLDFRSSMFVRDGWTDRMGERLDPQIATQWNDLLASMRGRASHSPPT